MSEASSRRPAPSATGTLEQTPLAHILIYARNKRLTGAFELRASDGREGGVAFFKGRIAAARTTPAVAYFGAVAYELGFIDTDTLDQTLLELAQKKKLHGELLIERGAITEAQRNDVLKEQAARKVHHLFTLPLTAGFSFYEVQPGSAAPLVSLDPLLPIWRGIRQFRPETSIEGVLSKFPTATFKLVSETVLDHAGLGPEEAALVRSLSEKPMTIPQMRVSSSLPTANVDLLAYLLIISKCMEPLISSPPQQMGQTPSVPPLARPSSASVPVARPSNPMAQMPTVPSIRPSGSMPSSRPTPSSTTPGVAMPPPGMRTISTPGIPQAVQAAGIRPILTPGAFAPAHPSLSFKVPSYPKATATHTSSRPPPEIAAIAGPMDVGASGIAARAQSIESEDFFQALGLSQNASAEAVRAAYYRLVKLWHPDKLDPSLAPFRDEVVKVFAYMSQAHQTLTDPEARRSYMAGRAEQGKLAPRIRPEALKEIDRLLTLREFDRAGEIARELADADKEDTEARAIAAWSNARGGEAPEEALRVEVLALDKVVVSDRYCERALFYRGMLHKKLGNANGAIRDFNRVVSNNPKHIDAAREVRLFGMRSKKGGSGEHALGISKKK